MKVTVPLFLLVLATIAGYMLGTEAGRAQRDVLLVKLGRARAETEVALDVAGAAIEDAEAAAEEAADTATASS